MDSLARAPTVLLVDDEENILRSLQRLLRQQPYQIVTASSGDEALQLMAEVPADLVVSDARMPGMDGATLLAKIGRQWPDTIRILLTGYADMATTIKAINEGKIYRYIAKPWDDEDLTITLRQALQYQHTEKERKRLQALTDAQNKELQALNATLEAKVIERTEELRQTADMLDLAYAELKQSYVTTTEVFSSLINQRLPRDQQPNAKVIRIVKAFGEHSQIPEDDLRDLSMAAALYNIGKLSWSDTLLAQPSDLLTKEQRQQYRGYPAAGEQLLMTLDPLQGAAKVIRHHQERWSGNGFPDQLAGEQIPFGARLLRIAVDFVEFQCGLILERKVTRENALKLIRRFRDRLYDSELADQMVAFLTSQAPDIDPEDPHILALDTRRLEPGMVLARNLFASSGMLLLNEGKELSALLIEKLIAFEQGEAHGHRYTLYIHAPQTPEQGAQQL